MYSVAAALNCFVRYGSLFVCFSAQAAAPAGQPQRHLHTALTANRVRDTILLFLPRYRAKVIIQEKMTDLTEVSL